MPEVAKETLFVCEKEPNLIIVFATDQHMVVDGCAIHKKPVYIRFVRSDYGGELRTRDPKVIARIKSGDRFKDGRIVEVCDYEKFCASMEPVPVPERVVAGIVATNSNPESAPPPSPEPQQPSAARVPGSSAPSPEPPAAPEPQPAAAAAPGRGPLIG